MQELIEFIIFFIVLALLICFALADVIYDYCKKHVDNLSEDDEQ